MRTISIAREFSVTPGGRYNKDGPYSGEAFRHRYLEPALAQDEPVVIDLDGVAGLPPSFLEEAFGGLMRAHRDIAAERVLRKFRLRATEPDLQPYVVLIERYINAAARKAHAA